MSDARVEARAPIEPVSDQRSLMGCVIVDDQMHVEVGWYGGFDLIEELAEFDGTMAGITLADHPAGSDVESGEQRCGAMTLVVMATPCRLAGTHRQHGLAAVERLDLRLLVDAKHDGMGRRRNIKPDHIADLGDEVWIGGELGSFPAGAVAVQRRAKSAAR